VFASDKWFRFGFQAGDDTVPVLEDEVLGSRAALAQVLVADVLLAYIFDMFDVNRFQAVHCSC
jgi:hypothetical protein